MVAGALQLVGGGEKLEGGRWAEPRDSKAEKAKTNAKAMSRGQ